jgi:hypothetical protein
MVLGSLVIDLPKILAAHALWLAGEPAGVRADLRGVDLRGVDLSGVDLSGVDLSGTNLCDSNLSGVNLRGADLLGAHLVGAKLVGADLIGADLRDANFCGADFSGAYLRSAKLPTHTVCDGQIATFCLSYWAMTTPDDKGQRWLQYGCETHTLDDWDRLAGDLAAEHHPYEADRYEAETRALVALCRTLGVGGAS